MLLHSIIDRVTSNDSCSKSPTQRILEDAANRLAIGPGQALLGGASLVVSIGLVEAQGHMRPINPKVLKTASNSEIMAMRMQRFMFSIRYATAQILPSMIQESSPSQKVAAKYGYPSNLLYGDDAPKRAGKFLSNIKLKALRGAIAGSVVLSQVVSLADVLLRANAAYSERILKGKEPPLDERPETGVVLRLTGEESDVTGYCMSQGGRGAVFPIYEQSNKASVQQLIRNHGFDGHKNLVVEDKPNYPVFWQVDNGRYSYDDSWRGFAIPKSWLFDMNKSESSPKLSESSNDNGKLLVLEADATSGKADVMSFKSVYASDLDIDLFEISQGFYKLRHSVSEASKSNYQVLRVILVDLDAIVKSGGGRESSAREYINELGLADIVIDARKSLVNAITHWLSKVTEEIQGQCNNNTASIFSWQKQNKNIPVVLETPYKEWFDSIKETLLPFGYEIIDRCDIHKFPHVDPSKIPFIVYEKNSSDTLHTIRHFVESGIVTAEKVCAFCPKYEKTTGLEKMGLGNIETFCSSVLYSQLLAWVREEALKGRKYTDIQRELDNEMPDLVTKLGEIKGTKLKGFLKSYKSKYV